MLVGRLGGWDWGGGRRGGRGGTAGDEGGGGALETGNPES